MATPRRQNPRDSKGAHTPMNGEPRTDRNHPDDDMTIAVVTNQRGRERAERACRELTAVFSIARNAEDVSATRRRSMEDRVPPAVRIRPHVEARHIG
jgi:hypothetical protein